MKCAYCDKQVGFWEWYTNKELCKQCYAKDENEHKKRKEQRKKEELKKLKEQYPKRNKKAILYALLYSALIVLTMRTELMILSFIFNFIIFFLIIKTYHYFKYKSVRVEKKQGRRISES